MPPPALECVEARHDGKPRGCVIWLHGLGADGHDFEPVVPELGLPLDFVFPHAPVRPVTLNGGIPMRAWFDLRSLDRDMEIDHLGIDETRRSIERLIAQETERGHAPGAIVLAGFSQGGAMALYTGLKHGARLAGLVGLSTWLPHSPGFDDAAPANRGTPVFMAHGSHDPVVAPAFGAGTRDALREAGWEVEWHEYPMPHAVCPEEITAVGRFLERVLGL